MEFKSIDEYTKMSEEERCDYINGLPEKERLDYLLKNRICMVCTEPIAPGENTVEVIFTKGDDGSQLRYVAHVQNTDSKLCMNFLLGDILDQTTPTIAVEGYRDE